MDLVSTTIDKYLKHRFNTNLSETQENQSLQSNEPNIDPPQINHIRICNTQPSCITLRDDLLYLAAGFENSQIYLWDLSQNLLTSESESIVELITDKTNFNEQVSLLLSHSGPVYNIKFVNNDDLMLSCSEDTTIRLWCLKTKCNVTIFRGHIYPIWSLDVAPKSMQFASASMDTTARLWRLDILTPLRIFCGHDDDVECVKFHPNEKYIATGSSDTTIRLWNTSDGKMVRLMVGHESPIISLSFLPDGKFLASASNDGVIKVWNLTSNSVISNSTVSPSKTISFSPGQVFIASCGIDNSLSLWQDNKEGLRQKLKLDFEKKSSNLLISHFSRDDKLFVITNKYDKDQDHQSANNVAPPNSMMTSAACSTSNNRN